MPKQLLPELSVRHFWAAGVILLVFLFTSTHPIRPHDFWWHMRAGQEIVTTGQIPEVDDFSFTIAGAAYDNYKTYWLMESAFYLVYGAGGPALIIFVQSLLVASAYTIVLAICWQQSHNWRIAATTTFFAALLGHNDWNVRPQGIAFPLAAICLFAIYAYRRRPRPWLLIAFPVCMVLWVNSHGSFVIALVLLGLWLTAELASILVARWEGRPRSLHALGAPAIALAASLAAALANPRGVGALYYLSDMSSNPFLRQFVPEWWPPTFDTRDGAFFLTGLLLSAAILALSPRRPHSFELFVFLAFGFLGLQTARGIVWYGIVMAPVLARHLAALVDEQFSRRGTFASTHPHAEPSQTRGAGKRYLNAAFFAAILVAAVLGLPWFKHLLPLPEIRQGLLSTETPVAATSVLLSARLPQPIFHDAPFGSYLIGTAYPTYHVFVDTRLELYPAQVWEDYFEIAAARPGWKEKLQRYGIRSLMLSPQGQAPLIAAARADESWREIYADSSAVLFVLADTQSVD